ncbi:glycosyltransferase WbuB [Lachnospiraceae bacterium]|nr:glycosyltransferase WbuB [Lachnospiraceae bacterium]
MKILFFITSSMERPSPSWHLMKALLEDTLRAGISIHAIQRHFPNPEMLPFPETILNNKLFSYSQINDIVIDRRDFVGRYLNGIVYSIKSMRLYRKNNDFDMIFVQSAATSLFYIAVAKHYAKNRPVLYNSQDMFPGSAVANGSMPKKWMQKVFYCLQKIAYKKADIITAISEDMKRKLLEQGVPEEKIRVIVNWYDDASVREIPWNENRFVKNNHLSPKKFYIQYAGTMGTNFNPEIILETAERLKGYLDIEFQMIGDGIRKKYLESEAEQRGLNNIVFYPLQSQDMVSDVYSACSVCLIPLIKGVIGNSVPSKAALLMACGRIIINSVDDECDYGRIFEDEKIGFSSGTADSEKIADDILFLYRNPIIKAEYEERAKEFAKREYSRTVNTIKYIEIFQHIAQGVK